MGTDNPVKRLGWGPITLAATTLVIVALIAMAYQSARTGLTWRQILSGKAPIDQLQPPEGEPIWYEMGSILPPREKIEFLTSQAVGQPIGEDPRISNIDTVDLDQDGLLDVIVCDTLEHRVSWIRQYPNGVFTEFICAPDDGPIKAPAHVQPFDFDRDGDLDLLVASLGQLFPTNQQLGSVIVLENDGSMQFHQRVIRKDIMRVSDVRGGDLDGDGDSDLVVAMFGAFDGGTFWLENRGDGTFKEHTLQTLSGPINCPIVDIDEDGDLDIALLVSQEWEEIYLFVNNGAGQFSPKLIWGATNEDFGSGNIRMVDLDQDGDTDVLYTNGDAWDYVPPEPRPWHGVHWLQNQGNYQFDIHRIATFGGPYSALPMDIDLDGDMDVTVTSMFNEWEDPMSQSVIWLENNGAMQFARRDISNTPTNIQTAAEGDFNGDGKTDFVTGGMYTDPPHDRRSRILLWTNHWPGVVSKPKVATPDL